MYVASNHRVTPNRAGGTTGAGRVMALPIFIPNLKSAFIDPALELIRLQTRMEDRVAINQAPSLSHSFLGA